MTAAPLPPKSKSAAVAITLATGLALFATSALADELPASTQPAAPGAATTKPAELVGELTLEQERAEYRQFIERDFADLPKIGDTTVKKLLSMEIEGGHLIVKSLLPTTDGMSQLKVTDWPGYARAMVGPADSLLFNFVHTDLAWRDAVVKETTVITHQDYLQINRELAWKGEERRLSVTLIQSRQAADEAGNPIRLTIQYTEVGDDPEAAATQPTTQPAAEPISDADVARPPGFREPVNVNAVLSASSFEQLRLNHPREVRAYLLPILQDLGAAALVRTSDPKMAWQVLGGSIEVDPKLKAQVDELLKQVDSGGFKERAKAEETLRAIGPEAAAAIAKMDLAALSPDARVAADNAIRQWQTLSPQQATQMAGDVNFLIDAAQINDSRLSNAAIAKLSKALGKPIDLPATLSADERIARLEALRPPAPLSTTTPSTRPAASLMPAAGDTDKLLLPIDD